MDLMRKKSIEQTTNSELLRCLSAFDLTLLGIGALIGAGVFVLTGVVAATQSGPAIIFSYLVAALACGFSALAYAELAASIGGCGSAYGYAYAGLGEVIAWIVGWDLLLEYSVSVSAVSVGWSGYFNDFLSSLNVHISPQFLYAPLKGGIANLLASGIIVLLAILLISGIKSSKRFNHLMVLVKLAILALFVTIAITAVEPQNWHPFAPFGWGGVIEGASLIFFAYVGFDAVSTTAEEAKNPQRDLPIGILASLCICTLIYIVVSGLLTGIVKFSQLNVSSPISYALLLIGHKTAAGFIGVGAIAGLSTVMLVLFYGLTRVFLAMARDGLLPRYFAYTNPKTKTPVRIILVCAFIIGITSAFMPIADLAELVNIGTLFAFSIVCSGVIILRYSHPELSRPFKTPWMPLIPVLGIMSCLYLIYNLPMLTMIRFVVWMSLGMVIYFLYSKKNSVLNQDI